MCHGSGIVSRPRALVSDLIAPEEGLAIALFQSGKAAAGPERFSYVANGSLHAPFLISCADGAGSRQAMIVSAEFEQAGMEVDGVTATVLLLMYGIWGETHSTRPSRISRMPRILIPSCTSHMVTLRKNYVFKR